MNESEVLANEDGRNFTEHQYRISILEEEGVMTLFRILKPKFGKDGNEWYVLHGEDLVSGICGFGKTLNSAIQDFNNQFDTEIKTNKNLIKKKMTNKPPEIGKRYRRKPDGLIITICSISDSIIMFTDTSGRIYHKDLEFSNFEELPDQEPTINKKGVDEALRQVKSAIKNKHLLDKETIIYETQNLVNELDKQRKVKNLYTKEEHVKKKPKSLHEESIWKPISEILKDYSHCYIRFVSGNIKLAQSIEGKFFGIDENIDNDHYINVKEYCTLTDFINQQESLEQRIADLEKRLPLDLPDTKDIDFSQKCEKCGVVLMYASGNFSCAGFYHDKEYCKEKEEEEPLIVGKDISYEEGKLIVEARNNVKR